MKTTLSTPSTIASAASVRSAVQISGLPNHSIPSSFPPRMRSLAATDAAALRVSLALVYSIIQ